MILKFFLCHLTCTIYMLIILNISADAEELLKSDDYDYGESYEPGDFSDESSDVNDCGVMDGRKLQFICASNYTQELKTKYKDRIVRVGAPYRVWQFYDAEELTRILVTFYKSPLFECDTLQFIRSQFYCDHQKEPVQLEYSEVHCMPFMFSYMDNLRQHCYHSPLKVRTVASAIQYAYNEQRMGGGAEGIFDCHLDTWVVLIAVILFLIA